LKKAEIAVCMTNSAWYERFALDLNILSYEENQIS